MSQVPPALRWDREKLFYDLLKKSGERLTKGGVDGLTDIALEDQKLCYKHVVALLQRQMRKLSSRNRICIFYILSNILRFSKRRYGSKDKYAKRVACSIGDMFSPLCECPAAQRDKIAKVLETWKKDAVFSSEDMERIFKVLEIPSFGRHKMSSHITDSWSTGRDARTGRDAGNPTGVGECTPSPSRAFEPKFYPTAGREQDVTREAPKSGGGSNSGIIGSTLPPGEEEYDPLSAANYIDGCEEAHQPCGVDLPPIPPQAGGPLPWENVNAFGQGLYRSEVAKGVRGDATEQTWTSALHAGNAQPSHLRAPAPQEELVGERESALPKKKEKGKPSVDAGDAGVVRVVPGFQPIDYMACYGFGQGMDGPPVIPDLDYNCPLLGGVLVDRRALRQTAAQRGKEKHHPSGHPENNSLPEKKGTECNAHKQDMMDLDFQGDSTGPAIPATKPQAHDNSDASSAMDMAESMAGSVCSHKEIGSVANTSEKCFPRPPSESPPPLPSEPCPEGWQSPPPPPPPPPESPPPPPPGVEDPVIGGKRRSRWDASVKVVLLREPGRDSLKGKGNTERPPPPPPPPPP